MDERLSDDGMARSTAGLSVAEVVALAREAGGGRPVAAQLKVGAEAWSQIQVWSALRAGSGQYFVWSLPKVTGLFGVPVVLDPELDPYRWMMLDSDGREMAGGRLDGGAV